MSDIQRKFRNPTPGWVGANVVGPDGTLTSVPVEPGGEVWMTEMEERMTAEAPRRPEDNPFVKEWDAPVEFDSFGQPTAFEKRRGVLVLCEDPPRPIASDRYVPPRLEPEAEVLITGAPKIGKQPPVKARVAAEEITGLPL